jgi:alanyl-tRNA synthetase
VGIDVKVVTEAWNAITAAYPEMAAMIVSSDTEKGKALAYAGVPACLLPKISAQQWIACAMVELGGKGGGKPGSAQGQGPNVDKVPAAIAASTSFAEEKL